MVECADHEGTVLDKLRAGIRVKQDKTSSARGEDKREVKKGKVRRVYEKRKEERKDNRKERTKKG